MKLADITAFRDTVLAHYAAQGRHDLPWRFPEANGTFDAYKITVSELMLQQTQVGRVIPKYQAFLERFPTVQDLAAAPLSEILQVWNGLGYNRRAKFLWQTARMVADDFDGSFPTNREALVTLPGIGPNTAGAILAYAFNQPAVFIETNIRTVFIHHFFAGQTGITDTALTPFITHTMPAADIRTWYWALMDYGTYLKQTAGNLSRASASYAKQSAFQGSRRQVRGQVLRLLTSGAHPPGALKSIITDERLPAVLDDLSQEGLIEKVNNTYRLRML